MENTLKTPDILSYNNAELNKIEFAKHLVKNGGSKVKAYQSTFPDAKESTALSNAHQYANNDIIKDTVASILVSGDVTNERLGIKLSKMLDIDKEYYDQAGHLRCVRDNQTQMQALRTILQLKGHLGTGGTNIDARSVTLNQVADVQVSQLASIVSDLKAMRERSAQDTGGQSGNVDSVESIRPDSESKTGDGGVPLDVS
jgi:hypothetical protein